MAIRVIYLFLFCFVFIGVGEVLSGKKPDVSDLKKENFALIEKETRETNFSVSLGTPVQKLECLGNFILAERRHKDKKGFFKSAVVLEVEDDSSSTSIYQDDILSQMRGHKSSLEACRNRFLEEKISTETFLDSCSSYQRNVADGLSQAYTELGKIPPGTVDIKCLHEAREFLLQKKGEMIGSADRIDPTLKNKCTGQENLCDALGCVSGWFDKRIKNIDADDNSIKQNGSLGFKETVEKVIQYDLLRSEEGPIVKNIPLSSINYEFKLPFNADGCMRPEMQEWVAESVDKFNTDKDAFYKDNYPKIKVIVKMYKEKYEAKLDRLMVVQKQSENAINYYSDFPESKVEKINGVIKSMKGIFPEKIPKKSDKKFIINRLKKIKSTADVWSSKEEIVEQYALRDAISCFDTYARLYRERIEDYERQIQEIDNGKPMSLGQVLSYLVQHSVLLSKAKYSQH